MNEIDKFLQDAQDWCTNFVCPIYDLDKEYPLQGSSILFTHDSKYFMITAAHVLDPINPRSKVKHKDLIVKTNQGHKFLADLVDGKICNTEHPSEDRNKDKFDFAYFKFTDNARQLLSNCTFLTMDMLNLSSEVQRDSRLICFGWLSDESKVLPNTGTLQLHSFTLLSEMVEDDYYYNLFDITRQDNIIIKFNRYKNTLTTHALPYVPHPYGMSGGAVLSLSYDENTNTTDAKLDAIGIEYHKKHDILIATKINMIFDHMKSNPNL